MGVFSFCLSLHRRAASNAADASAPATARSDSCGAIRPYEPQISFAELMAASAFLDFGGLLDERWLSGRRSDEDGMSRQQEIGSP